MLVRTALYVNDLVIDLGFQPFPIHTIFVGRGGIEFLDVEVLNIRAVVGKSPGDTVVVADHDQRSAGHSESLDIPARTSEMHFVPDGGNRQLQVRIVSEKRSAGGRVISADDPIVAPEAVTDFLLRFRKIAA